MSNAAKVKKEKKFGLDKHRHVLCRNCMSTITSPDTIVTVDGEHIHAFINPAGIKYTIACYSSALGCITHGILTLENTWFDGFSWNFALCSQCLIHLGWFYHSQSEHFFGLILDRLTVTG